MGWFERLRGRFRSHSQSPDEWLTSTVAYFVQLGFFAEQSNSPEPCILREQFEELWGMDVDPTDRYAELMLLKLDEQRVWWEDTEADVGEENLVYLDTLRQWARISRGVFDPHDCREDWETATGPIAVSFRHHSRLVVLSPEYRNDYIDVNILPPINRVISDTGMQFECYRLFDQTAFIVALTADEKLTLRKQRGWKFAW